MVLYIEEQRVSLVGIEGSAQKQKISQNVISIL